jgi:pimeloyl-ACP methyl ester carboxylesterase
MNAARRAAFGKCASKRQHRRCAGSSRAPARPRVRKAPCGPPAIHSLVKTMPVDVLPPADESAAAVAALAGQARTLHTPCGDGLMVWRVWGAGEPLCLFHGGSGSWTHWIRTIPELARHFELWVPDLPGLGESAMPPKPWIPTSIASVIVAAIETLMPTGQALRLAGFSFGGHIAGLVAAKLQERVRELTLIGVAALGLRTDPRTPFAKERGGMSPAEIAAVYRQNLEVLMFADERNIDALAVHIQIENIRRARFRSRPFAATDDLARALGAVRAPLKTIWGSRDIIARPSLEARLAILRQHHPELQVRLVEGAGHWVMYEAWQAFNGAFLDLLRGRH